VGLSWTYIGHLTPYGVKWQDERATLTQIFSSYRQLFFYLMCWNESSTYALSSPQNSFANTAFHHKLYQGKVGLLIFEKNKAKKEFLRKSWIIPIKNIKTVFCCIDCLQIWIRERAHNGLALYLSFSCFFSKIFQLWWLELFSVGSAVQIRASFDFLLTFF
jgi:hypothetical protein